MYKFIFKHIISLIFEKKVQCDRPIIHKKRSPNHPPKNTIAQPSTKNAIAPSLTRKYDRPITYTKRDRPFTPTKTRSPNPSQNTIAQPLTKKVTNISLRVFDSYNDLS
ncbi:MULTISPECIES: hypothetical protein [Pseudanabaena]|uniref:hypothetical protein n=1 Tax=Pseudanabaena TaxID=1152 RepID=UPI0024788719|nr:MULTISPECIES: hypothetical protein [Pseudanabaena]WGS70715.1 hypothetical protein OA858_13365 [Pseudanabaena galeata CCNP1313]